MQPDQNRKPARRWQHGAIIAAVIAVAAALLASAALATSEKQSAVAFHDAMRKLWEDHVTWTRLAIVSIVADLPDAEVTVVRLLQNQKDIGDAVKPFYGDSAGDRLTSLLTDHIVIAAEILFAAKRGDGTAVDDAVARWYANADDIARFLSAANPKAWPFEAVQHMMREHLDLTFQEAVAQLQGDFALSVSTYDEIHRQILEMADMLSDGIIAQFPQRFNGPVPA